MIFSVWKPYYIKGEINYYELVPNESILEKKGTTAYKVVWVCDNPMCKTRNKQHSINACHLKKENMCFTKQICRICQCTGEGNGRYGDRRKWVDFFDENKLKEIKNTYSNKWKGDKNPSKKDEVKTKKGQPIINEKYIEKILNKKGFKLLELIELNGKKSVFLIECQNNHKSIKKYLNLRNTRKYICQKCFYESIELNLTDEEIREIENYKKIIRALTAKTYKNNKETINPKNLKIGRGEYHIDHKYSLYEGFKNNVDPKIMSSIENLEIISEHENCSKQSKCSITLDELIEKTNYLYKKNNKL